MEQQKKRCPKCSEIMELIDDSFDHEFGVQVIKYWFCPKCKYEEDWEDVDLEEK
jgi:C4-type Zn-finger protein